MKPEHTCSVVRDLLPLYLEKAVSQDSVTLIQNHLAHCVSCRGALETMEAPLQLPADRDATPLAAFGKTLWKHDIVKLLLGTFAALFALVFLTCGDTSFHDGLSYVVNDLPLRFHIWVRNSLSDLWFFLFH